MYTFFILFNELKWIIIKINKKSSILSKYFPNCNFEMPDEANFCLNCMSPFENSNSKNTNINSTEMANKKRFDCFSLNNINKFLSTFKSILKRYFIDSYFIK